MSLAETAPFEPSLDNQQCMSIINDMKMTDTLRNAIDAYPSRYRLAKDSGVDQAQLSRFMNGKVDLTLRTVEKLAPFLGLRLEVDDAPVTKRPKRNPAPRRKGA